MSDHEHAHEHGHSHDLGSWRDVVTTIGLLVVAAIKLVLGWLLVNPAIVADAGHTAFDALFTTATWFIKTFSRRWRSHKVQDHLPSVVGIVICILTVVIVTVLTVSESFKPIDVSRTALFAAVATGFGGYLISLAFARFMAKGGSDLDRGNARHLDSDARASLIVAVSGLIAIVFAWIHWLVAARAVIILGGAVLIVVIAWLNSREAASMAHRLRQCIKSDRLTHPG